MDPAQVALPATATALLTALLVYQLWPVLSLLPSLNFKSLLVPAGKRNLPREFFGLPPRPRDAKPSFYSKLGLRGAISITLAAHAAVALVGGWVFLAAGSGSTVALAVALTPVPACIALMAGYSLALGAGAGRNEGEPPVPVPVVVEDREKKDTNSRRFANWLLAGGGVTHASVFPRIFPLAFIPTIIAATLAGTMPSFARQILLGITSALAAASIGLTAAGVYKARRQPRGPIFLPSRPDSPLADTSADAMRQMMEGSSWLTSFSHNDTMQQSSFSLSTEAPTPPTKDETTITPERQRTRSKTKNGSPTSWISSRNSADSHTSVPEWTFESPEKPKPAAVRSRSASMPPSSPPAYEITNSSANISNIDTTGANSSSNTSHSFVTASAGGSILGEYEASPFQRLPRGFESIASMPPLPSLPSTASLKGPTSMASHSALIPRGGSTWTLAASSDYLPTPSTAYTRLMTPALHPRELEPMDVAIRHQESTTSLLDGGRMLQPSLSSMHTPKKRTSHRPPPPPPLPALLPLPPTPNSQTPRDTWVLHDDRDVELYLDYWVTGDWVTVLPGGERVDDWGKSDRGAVSLAVLCVLACYALDMPLLLFGPTTVAIWSFAASITLPAPVLCLASYIMRSRGKAQVYRKKASTSSADTHVSLALMAEVDLPFPLDLSPKLTPPLKQPFRTDGGQLRTDKVLRPKPSLTTFGFIPRVPGYSPPSQLPFTVAKQRRHTMYGGAELEAVEKAAETTFKNMDKRRSQEVWCATGQAREGLSATGRAVEMLKPAPALCVMEDTRPNSGMLKRLRGGIVSMLAGDISVVDEEKTIEGIATQLPAGVASPPHSTVRNSGMSQDAHDHAVEIRTASVARLSASPSFILGLEGQEEKVNSHLGWLPAALLPALLSPRKPTEQKTAKKSRSTTSLKNAVTMRKKSSASKVGRSKPSTIKSVPSDSQPDVRLPFSPSLDNIVATPYSRRRRGSKKHRRNFSSIDLSTDSHAPMSSTPYVRGGHIRQASSLSLPAVDFSRGDFFARPSDIGVDLPPVPTLTRVSTAPSQRIYMDTVEAIAASNDMDMSIANNAALARLLLGEDSAAAAEWASLQNTSFMRDVLIAQAFSNTSGYRSTPASGTPASRARTNSDNDTYVSFAVGPRRARASIVYREPPVELVVAVGDSDNSASYTPPRATASLVNQASFGPVQTTSEMASVFEADSSQGEHTTSAGSTSGIKASLRSLRSSPSMRSIRSALSRTRTLSTASGTNSEHATTTDESLGPFPPPLPPMPSLPVYLYKPPVPANVPLPAAHPHPPPLSTFPQDSHTDSYFGSLPSALDAQADLRLQSKDSNTSITSDTSFGETYKATVGRAMRASGRAMRASGRAMRASVIALSTEALGSLPGAPSSTNSDHDSSEDGGHPSSEAGHSTRSMVERPPSPTPDRGARSSVHRPSTPATPTTQPGLRPLRLVEEVAKRNSLIQAKPRSPSPTETEFETRPLPRPPSQAGTRVLAPVDRRYSEYRESLISSHRFSVASSHERHAAGISGYEVGAGHRPNPSTDTFGQPKQSKTSTQSGRSALSVLSEKSNSMGGSRVSLVSVDKENGGPGYMLGGRKRRSKASNGPVIRV